MDDQGLKTRSLGQIVAKPCVVARGHNVDLIFMKLGHNNNINKISVKVINWVIRGQKEGR